MSTERDGVVTLVPRKVVGNGKDILIELVCIRAILVTEIYGGLAVRVVRRIAYRDRHGGSAVGSGCLTRVTNAGVTYTQLVRNRVADARLQLGYQRMGLVTLIIAGIVEVVRARRSVVLVGRSAAIVVAQHHLVVIVDVPVQSHNVGRPDLGRVLAEAGSVVTRKFLVLLADLVELIHRNEAVDVVLIIHRSGSLVLVILATHEEEELVLHQRAAEGETVGLSALLGILLARGTLTHEVVVTEVGVGRTAERVGTRLGYGVDTAARETALANVIGGDYNLNLLDGLHRDGVGRGLTAVGSRRGKAEDVVRNRTVDLERVVTVVGTGERDTARRALRRACQRRQTCHVGNAAVDGGDILNHAAREVHCGTRLVGIETVVGRADHDNGVNLRRLLERNVEGTGLTEAERNVGQLDCLITYIRYGDRVGTSGTHTLNVVTAVDVGQSAVLRSGRVVHRDDGGSYQNLTIRIGNLTVDARRGDLRTCRADHHQRENQKEKMFHSDLI